MLVGNKLDLVQENPQLRQVSAEEARALCSQNKDMKFIETSSMANTNVSHAFEMLL